MEHEILDSINRIDRSSWEKLFGDIPEGYAFFKAIEDSGMKEFSLFYVVISEGSEPLLIAPLFIADFNLDIALEGWLRRMSLGIRRLFPRFLVMRTVFCGSPFGENGILGVSVENKENPAIILKLRGAIEGIAEEKKCPLIIFKDFTESHTFLLDILQEKGFFKTESLPSAVLELGFNDFEGYLGSLSPGRRKNLLRKLKKGSNIEVKITHDPSAIIADIYRLYLNTYESGEVRFEKLTPEFFLNLSSGLKDKAMFFLYYAEGRLAAFNLCFLSGDTLIDKFIGFDYSLAHKYNLYFFSWCYNVKWCLKNRIRYYQTGQTDYAPKLDLGGRLTLLFAYLKHRNIFMHNILKLLARSCGPQTRRERTLNDAE